jgi:hypothetical protein
LQTALLKLFLLQNFLIAGIKKRADLFCTDVCENFLCIGSITSDLIAE